jgi:hypothetical protein
MGSQSSGTIKIGSATSNANTIPKRSMSDVGRAALACPIANQISCVPDIFAPSGLRPMIYNTQP